MDRLTVEVLVGIKDRASCGTNDRLKKDHPPLLLESVPK